MNNNTHIKHIVEAMNQDKLIVFVGAGASQNSGLPSWGKLIEEFKDELNLNDENDYLRIPQYYYDTFGQQKYLDKIIEIFDRHSHATPNDIHDQIYNINPKHIITTNYDTLLEDKMNSAIKKYEVIRDDLDIPYSLSGNYIIKMHGDISRKNFVLKEDDYLDYENNYQMISTLIKSLIMNNTILFIGYSLSDSTFNSIFRLINNYFGNNAKNAYFYTAKATSKVLTEYYNKKGIKVISNDSEKTEKYSIGEKTTLFLKEIANYQIPKYKTDKDIWNQIKGFEKMKFIEGRDLLKYLEVNNDASLDPVTRDSFKWRNAESDSPKLSKEGKLLTFIEEKTDLSEFLGYSTANDNNYKFNSFLNEAFNLYKNGEYSEAIKSFRRAANRAFSRTDYYNFLIAEFNVNQLKRLVRLVRIDRNEESLSLDESVFANIEFPDIIENIYNNADKHNKKLISFLNENIFNYRYLHQKLFRVHDLYNKIKKERHNLINKGESYNNNLYLLINEVENLNRFLNLNCICLEHYTEYKAIINLYFESLLIAFDIHNLLIDSEGLNASSRVEAFDTDDIKNILPHVDSKMIPVYFDYFEIKKIHITEDAYTYLTTKIVSIVKDGDLNVDSQDYWLLRKYTNFLKYIEIHDYKKIVDIFEISQLNWEMFKEMRVILNIIILNFNKLEQDDKTRLLPTVNRHLNDIFDNSLDLHARNYQLYSVILEIYSNHFPDERVEVDIKKLNQTLTLIKVEHQKIEDIATYKNLIINFYKYFTVDTTNTIEEILKKYNKLSTENINYSFVISIMENEIYNFDNLEASIYNYLISKVNKEDDNSIILFPDPQKVALSNLYNLHIKGYYSKEQIKDDIDSEITKGVLPEFDWTIFDDYSIHVIDKLIENRELTNVEKYFVKNEQHEEAMNEWKNQKIEKIFNEK
ncbi:SIR2 family protein [Aerococcus viridans]|uniref:SIR2 family protein n=1 Tax=Aerococcus viridans TaxID=1377 RepID=UPI0002E5DFC1|nr:SIR2 family protein [Aerococcus viridans]